MKTLSRSLPIALVVFAIGCGPSIAVTTEYDPEASFSSVQRYDWATPSGSQDTQGLRTDNPQTDARIRRAVDSYLADEGYVLDAENPGFLIGYNALVLNRVSAETIADNYSYGSGWGYTYYGLDVVGDPAQRTVTTYEEGTLIIDVLNPETRALMWRGTARAELDPDDTPDDRVAIVEKAVEELFSYFPPR